MQQDANVYFVLFGRVHLYAIADETDPQNSDKNVLLGKATLGWCLGEEILYDAAMQTRREIAICDKESCLIGIPKDRLTNL